MALAAKRLTQAALAEHLGVNPATVNHWIKGRRKLTIEDVARIAVFLEVDPAVIAFPPMQSAPTRKPRTSTRTKPLPKPRTPRRALPSPLAPTGT